jgi:hypothetical protein
VIVMQSHPLAAITEFQTEVFYPFARNWRSSIEEARANSPRNPPDLSLAVTSRRARNKHGLQLTA